MKSIVKFQNRAVPLLLTAAIHLLVIPFAKIQIEPNRNPDIKVNHEPATEASLHSSRSKINESTLNTATVKPGLTPQNNVKEASIKRVHYRKKSGLESQTLSDPFEFSPPPFKRFFSLTAKKLETNSSKTVNRKLLPPRFSAKTIPQKPPVELQKEVDDNNQQYIQGDIFKDAVALDSNFDDLRNKEKTFTNELTEDIQDGVLDMPFSRFIITAEYFFLSKALSTKGLRPNFTLDQALNRYNDRLELLNAGQPKEFSGQSIVILLQRYAENKFYPDRGSGMLLESLFHNLNDCESGTKEILAYLNDLYPGLKSGTNRGLLQTTAGEVIGHMQAYLYPGQKATQIIDNENGVAIETTRVGYGSIVPHNAGDIYPLEDFVVSYYPELVSGTALEKRINKPQFTGQGEVKNVVGVGNNLLKMRYRSGNTILSSQFYDLANIRTQKIENEFVQSLTPGCDPEVNPANIHQRNFFSNFVLIDPSLRKKLMNHYLAGLQYWDNSITPQWRAPAFLPTYDNLVQTILKPNQKPDKEILIDGTNSTTFGQIRSHTLFLNQILPPPSSTRTQGDSSGYIGCTENSSINDLLLTYLFKNSQSPGVYFLPSPSNNLSWTDFITNILNDCFTIPENNEDRVLLSQIEQEALRQGSSLRNELYLQAGNRGLASTHDASNLDQRISVLRSLFTGAPFQFPAQIMNKRRSVSSEPREASIFETLNELGKTGINVGLLQDAFDFLKRDQFMSLIIQFANRSDLTLSLKRANTFIQGFKALFSEPGDSRNLAHTTLIEIYSSSENINLKLAAGRALLDEHILNTDEISHAIVRYLKQTDPPATATVELLNYGLKTDDAIAFNRSKIKSKLEELSQVATSDASKQAQQIKYVTDLIDLFRTSIYFHDQDGQNQIFAGLQQSALNDFSIGKRRSTQTLDYGILFNKLYALALISDADQKKTKPHKINSYKFLNQFIDFASRNPLAKLMTSLVYKAYSQQTITNDLKKIIDDQYVSLALIDNTYQRQLPEDDNVSLTDTLHQIGELVGNANVITYFLHQLPDASIKRVSGLNSDTENDPKKYLWHLEKIHRIIARMDIFNHELKDPTTPQQRKAISVGAFDKDFYLQDSVSESFALLGHLSQTSEPGKRVRFRKISSFQEIIKKLENVQVFADSATRTLTRQDMSLLTLLLNETNTPAEVSRLLKRTIETTENILRLDDLTQDQKDYYFAPHFPYLSQSDAGFLYSPETIKDMYNAHQWGPKNEIILSSYLYFKNLPEDLPEWLLRTAVWRSEYERERMNHFEQYTFLPMIQECENNFKTFPRGLFNAKWRMRKPFGEDAFPGTLLLLRTGYLEITPKGMIIETEKYKKL